VLVRVMAAWRACVEGEQARPGRRAGAWDRQDRYGGDARRRRKAVVARTRVQERVVRCMGVQTNGRARGAELGCER
jgi:hypothetical protein